MSLRRFREQLHFLPHFQGYRILPFQFLRWSPAEVLLVNEVGEHLFLGDGDFHGFVTHVLSPSSPTYLDLKSKHFLVDSNSLAPIELLAAKYRTKKSFLNGFTSLHMFVVTLRCDHSCPYCQVSRVTSDRKRFDMSDETARRAVDLMLRSPAPRLKVEFQGGEPLLNFDLVKLIVEYAEERNKSAGKSIEYVIATNLSSLSDESLGYMLEHSILVSTSLDGPAFLHNANRPRPGNDSHALTVHNVRRAREALGHDAVSAIMTTTALSLDYPVEIVDEYVAQGFDAIFLRPISPYGFAVRSKAVSAYQLPRFIDFYRKALDHIIELNARGVDFVEIYAQILLRKILTPFATGYVDLQSPAGAGISAVAYNYDGSVYASDESRMLAEMGDSTFRLGSVHENSYEEIFGGPLLQKIVGSSCVESLPGCADCAFQTFCGADPVFHHATQGDMIGHRPTSLFCGKNMALIRHMFELLRSRDSFVIDLLTSWATNRPLRTTGEVYPQ